MSSSPEEALTRAVAVLEDELVDDSDLLTTPRWLDDKAVVFVPFSNRRYIEAPVKTVTGDMVLVRVTVLGRDRWFPLRDTRVHKDSPYT